LNHIDFFSENAIEDGGFNIHLIDFEVICGSKSY
jgi:hypothetical protein